MKDELVTKDFLEKRLLEQDARWYGYMERRFAQLEARLTKQLKDSVNEIFNLVDKFMVRLDNNDIEHAIMQRDIAELQRHGGLKP